MSSAEEGIGKMLAEFLMFTIGLEGCTMLIATCVILLLIGLVAIARGRRAIFVDDHPWCRGCRFDLFGLDVPVRTR